MSDPLVLRADHGPVAVLTLNRPHWRNALSRDLVAALGDALSKAEVEPAVRVVVLTGAGPTFCAGMDMKEAVDAGDAEDRAVADLRGLADLIQQVHVFRRPTIAVLNGDAYGGGAGLAAACDFAIAESHAQIGYPEVRRGLAGAVVLHDLVRQVGARRARALMLTGAPASAEQAELWGLVNMVVPAGAGLEAALELGRALLHSAPIAVETVKRLLDESDQRPADLRGSAAISAALRASEEAEEGMRAFLEKRPPRWAAGG